MHTYSCILYLCVIFPVVELLAIVFHAGTGMAPDLLQQRLRPHLGLERMAMQLQLYIVSCWLRMQLEMAEHGW